MTKTIHSNRYDEWLEHVERIKTDPLYLELLDHLKAEHSAIVINAASAAFTVFDWLERTGRTITTKEGTE